MLDSRVCCNGLLQEDSQLGKALCLEMGRILDDVPCTHGGNAKNANWTWIIICRRAGPLYSDASLALMVVHVGQVAGCQSLIAQRPTAAERDRSLKRMMSFICFFVP